MNDLTHILSKRVQTALVILLIGVLPAACGEDNSQSGTAEGNGQSSTAAVNSQPSTAEVKIQSDTAGNVEALEIDAVVTAIDQQTREISLGMGMGLKSTAFVPTNLDIAGINVGDHVTGTYVVAAATKLRKPTEEDLAEPWVVLEEGALTADGTQVELARQVRAVVTILGNDEEQRTMVATDSRNMMHFITNVQQSDLAAISDGQVVVEFTEAMALKLQKKS